MNKFLTMGAASAMALGAVAAHASISPPSNGASDLILFAEVINTATGNAIASYAGDTGVVAPAYSGGVTTTLTLQNDSNLSALFAADNSSADSIVYAVLGGNYSGKPGKQALQGNANMATTAFNPAQLIGSAATAAGNLISWESSLTNTISGLNSNFSGANSVEGPAAATAGIWDYNSTGGIVTWNGNGPFTGVNQGITNTLYGVTGAPSGSGTDPVTVTTLGTTSLTSAGLKFTAPGSPPPVPLPAAVWLLGSGLLGLAGVARRKSKTA